MRRNLGTPMLVLATLLTLGLAACGQESDDTATDPASETTSAPATPSEPATPSDPATPGDPSPTIDEGGDGPVAFTEVAILTNTEEEGTVSTTPVALDSEKAVAEFTGQFTGQRMADDIRAAIADAPDTSADQALVGVVLAIGCDSPVELTVERVDGAVQVSPVMPKNQVQCFAAQTSVAILVVDTVKLSSILS